MGHRLIVLPPTERHIFLAVIVLIVLIFRVGPVFLSGTRRKMNRVPGAPRDYGIIGGAVCPKCGHPFSLALFSLKLGLDARLARCESCGKWSVVRRSSPDELRAAELAEAQPSQPIREKSEEEKLKDLVDQSRFTDRG